MPANLTQQYLKAEERYRRAATLEEELLCLQEMMKEIPKHKGTDHLQAELKSKISNAKKELAAESGSKKVRGLRIPRQGAGTAVILVAETGQNSIVVVPAANLGIRIEDMVLVTQGGAKLLSGALPRDPGEIEKALGR